MPQRKLFIMVAKEYPNPLGESPPGAPPANQENLTNTTEFSPGGTLHALANKGHFLSSPYALFIVVAPGCKLGEPSRNGTPEQTCPREASQGN